MSDFRIFCAILMGSATLFFISRIWVAYAKYNKAVPYTRIEPVPGPTPWDKKQQPQDSKEQAEPVREYVFPDTAPPEGYQKGTSYSVVHKQFDGLWYARHQIHSGVWRWIFDEQYQIAWVDLKQKADLWNALSTRLLTQDELEKAQAYGLSLSTDDLPRYVCDEGFDRNVFPRFQEGSVVDAWKIQEIFQRIAKHHEPEAVPLNTV